jgi:hypothetical protein
VRIDGFSAAVVVNAEEEIDETRDDLKPSAPGLPRDESFSKVEDAANPEKLAGNKHYEDGKQEQVSEAPPLVRVHKQEGRIGKDQQKKDNALVSDDAPINYRETDHTCASRAG